MQRIVLTCMVALALLPEHASACTCKKIEGRLSEIAIVRAYCEHERVFIGKAHRILEVDAEAKTMDYYLSVSKDFKGNIERPVIIRSTDCCSCDAHFELGAPSLIFANVLTNDTAYLQASFCSWTGRVEYSKEVIAVLEQLTSAEGDPCTDVSLRKWTDVTKQREIDEMRSLQSETMKFLRETARQPR